MKNIHGINPSPTLNDEIISQFLPIDSTINMLFKNVQNENLKIYKQNSITLDIDGIAEQHKFQFEVMLDAM